MISCQHCEELLNARLDGYLTEQDAPRLEEHLAQCPDCRSLDRDLTSLHHRLQKLSFDPPEDLTAAILSQLEVPQMNTAKKKKGPWAAIACAAAAVVLMVVVLTPQMFPFGGSDAESAEATESVQAPTAADIAGDTAPAEGAALEENLTETEPLTLEEARNLLIDYLIDQGLSLDLSPGTLSEDGAFWTFTGWDMDRDENFQFTVYCSDGYVEEVLLP